MLVTRYKNPVQNYKRGLDLFNDFFNSLETESNNTFLADFNPSVNTREGKEAYHIDVDLPGMKKDDVDINIEDNILTISGNRKVKDEVKEDNYYKIESSFGEFRRSFTLPEIVDVENITAYSNDGVLEIVIPKLKVIDKKAKKIEIK